MHLMNGEVKANRTFLYIKMKKYDLISFNVRIRDNQ